MEQMPEDFKDFTFPPEEGVFAGYICAVEWGPVNSPIKRFISVKIADCSGTPGWAIIGSIGVINKVLTQLRTVGWTTDNIWSAESLFTLLEDVAENKTGQGKFWFVCHRRRRYAKDGKTFFVDVTFL